MSDTTPTATHSPDSANLKRKVVAIVGLWGGSRSNSVPLPF